MFVKNFKCFCSMQNSYIKIFWGTFLVPVLAVNSRKVTLQSVGKQALLNLDNIRQLHLYW